MANETVYEYSRTCWAPPPPIPLPPCVVVRTFSRKRVAQITWPATRIRPKASATGAPSVDDWMRRPRARPTSTAAEPPPRIAWSIIDPATAPAAWPIVAALMPSTVPPIEPPIADPAAERRTVAIARLVSRSGKSGPDGPDGGAAHAVGKRKTPASRRAQASVSRVSQTA